MPRVGFEPTIAAGERPYTYALDRAATGTGFVTVLLFFFSTFMQGTYNYTCKTRHVPRVYNGAAFLWLQFIVDVMLFTTTNVLCFYISTLRVMWAVLSMVVFCCSLTSCFPGMLPRYVCIYVCMYYYYYLLRLA